MMRLLVTGGAGMIGRRVTQQWRQAGGHVAVLDNLSSGLPMPEATLAVPGDIGDEALLAEVLAAFRPDAILHLAAVHHIPTCENQRAYCLDVNVLGTERVLKAAEEADVQRVVIASSGAVYAWQDGPLTEHSSPLAPADNYSLSKYCNEQQLQFWSSRGQRMGRAARIFNTVAHDDPNAHLIPDVLKQLRQSSDGCIHLGNLTPRRDYLHADDIARGLIAMLHDSRTDVAFDAINLCSGVEHSVEQLVQQLGQLVGVQVNVAVDQARKRRVDRPSQLGNPGRARELLGWQPRYPFSEALQRVVFPDRVQ
ncbi:NAD(P)-dependent oxidoreductase [Pseudomonas sp. HMWF032]|uniref:NAD-dependent epimerase/dehydratase family protein n=1 Tax=unclassified Pseudomonas TaxID=196821 RepID=UPI000D3C6C1A|nr:MULTISPECIES: NAD(P)-dependent oxidoreductase [unclassified Pseudomonas]PTS82285.1 NAD(P)-dependent oxidoreductase [Pseudomonas sp. HMWF032]PTT84312.1 NAD(P)-dependent oxidoreductase [Pseudomonas sp. HMWF010]WAC46010.1 NAD(P)-dependent oxidoreductase [Pseudomonas sp. SL4(2022)]